MQEMARHTIELHVTSAFAALADESLGHAMKRGHFDPGKIHSRGWKVILAEKKDRQRRAYSHTIRLNDTNGCVSGA